MASEKPLDALLHLSQDFPKYSAALARKVTIPPNIRSKSLETLERGPVRPAIYINGKAYTDAELNVYSCVAGWPFQNIMMISIQSSQDRPG